MQVSLMVNIPMSEQEVPPRIRDIISRIGVSYPDIDYVEKYKYDDRLRGVLYFEPKFDGSNIRLIAREGYLIISSRRKLVATPQFIRGFIEAINNSYNPAVADITIDSLYEWMEKNEFIVFAELFGYKNTPMRIHKDWMYEWDLRIFDVFSVSEKRFVEPDKWRSGPISNISVEFVTGEPRSFDELVARIRALLRRSGKHAQTSRLVAAGIVLDMETRTVTINGKGVELTPTEFSLLKLFMRHPRRAFTRETLLNRVLGYDYDGGTNIIDVHISHLRNKLNDRPPRLIRTIYGVGYAFEPEEAA